ncbi:MAG: HNH endonuclease signature motif containing protein [Mycobacterium sp.]|nr:HNH endonuclease signature motif containing protein [Mycobacterium sp.]
MRDGGCAHPGCGRPVSWCDAHHIRPWSSGGHTSIDNGVLLCRLHHTAIHHGGWQVYLGADRHPWFIPPHKPDEAEPAHLRSHARRTMTDLPAAA